MASVSSLDKDLSKMRLAKYTAQDSQEIKDWIGGTLGENLPPGDLMVVLKDGVILCKLANRLNTSGPKLKFKQSGMPFVQMENISHFLSFVSRPPVSLAAHDVFLTVDLFEQKDPAQVIQCLGAFSRVANKLDPISFPTTIGGLKVPGALSPQLSGGWSPGKRNVSGGSSTVGGFANAYVQSAAATGAPTPFGKPTVPPRKLGVSSWSKPTDEKATAPAWNIAQYGYMGGASQGNQGVSFGARRQITNNPVVKGPTLEEKEKLWKNSADDSRRQQEEALERRRMEEKRRLEEEQLRIETEERRRAVQEANLRREREEEKTALEIEHRLRKEEEDRKKLWQHEQEHHREIERVRERERELASERREEEARRVRDAETQRKLDAEKSERERERERIRQLERELEKARERERVYEAEKEERRRQDTERMRRDAQEAVIRKHRTGDSAYGHRTSERDSLSIRAHKTGDRERENMETERRFLTGAWRGDLATPPSPATTNPIFPQHTPDTPPLPPRALPTPPPRKLPPAPTTPNRVGALPSSRYFAQDHLSSEPMHRSNSWETNDDGAAAEKREQEKKQAYKWARCVIVLIPDPPNPLIPTAQEVEEWITDRVRSMSLLERERERERERQREWEANQREMEERREMGDSAGDGYGVHSGTDEHAWDINQYGYIGGADQGKMGVAFGTRRQIIGPRKW